MRIVKGNSNILVAPFEIPTEKKRPEKKIPSLSVCITLSAEPKLDDLDEELPILPSLCQKKRAFSEPLNGDVNSKMFKSMKKKKANYPDPIYVRASLICHGKQFRVVQT